jgi:hypothetical protein
MNATLRRRLILLCGLIVVFPYHAAADQQRIFAVVQVSENGDWATQLLEAAVESGRVVSVTAQVTTPGYFQPGVERVKVVGGGRFIAWLQGNHPSTVLRVFDRLTESLLSATGVDDIGLSDHTRPRLFVPYVSQCASCQTSIAALTESGLTVVPNSAGFTARALSRDAGRLFAADNTPGHMPSVVVLDVATGARLQTISLPADVSWVGPVALSEDESRAWVATASTNPNFPLPNHAISTLRAFNLVTGLEELAVPLRTDGWNVDGLVIDDVNRRAAVALSFRPNQPFWFDQGQLQFISTETGSKLGAFELAGRSDIHLERQSRTLLVLSRRHYSSGSCDGVWVSAFPSNLGPPVNSVSDARLCLGAAVASPPAPPTLAPAMVGPERAVTLSWTGPSEMTSGFVVEAGSAPGLADLAALRVSSATTFTVPFVPAGTYYVRIRAANGIGLSVPSNEIRVEVP